MITTFPSFGYYPYLTTISSGLVILRAYKSFMNVVMSRGIFIRICGGLVMAFGCILGIAGSLLFSGIMNSIEYDSLHYPVISFFLFTSFFCCYIFFS